MGAQSITLLTFIIYEDNPETEITYYSPHACKICAKAIYVSYLISPLRSSLLIV